MCKQDYIRISSRRSRKRGGRGEEGGGSDESDTGALLTMRKCRCASGHNESGLSSARAGYLALTF